MSSGKVGSDGLPKADENVSFLKNMLSMHFVLLKIKKYVLCVLDLFTYLYDG